MFEEILRRRESVGCVGDGIGVCCGEEVEQKQGNHVGGFAGYTVTESFRNLSVRTLHAKT